MKRINHVHIVEVSSRCLVSDVYGMLEWEIPHRECLEFRISRLDSVFMFVIKLAETHRHFTASRSGCGNDNQRTACHHIIVFAKTFVRIYQCDIIRITFDCVMAI